MFRFDLNRGLRVVTLRRTGLANAAAGAGLLALALAAALSPALAQPLERLVAKPRVSLSARGGLGSFTPADADPRLVAALARNNLSANGLRFTPAGASVRLNRSVTVAVRARADGSALGGDRAALGVIPATVGIAPVAYNLGAAVGWKRFALSGDVAKIDGVMGGHEAVDLGVSYNARKWSARVGVAADQPTGVTARALGESSSVAADLGGSYRLTRNLDVTAGVRYRASDRDRLTVRNDAARDSQAVYVGTAFKF